MIQYVYWALFILGFVALYFAFKLYNETEDLLKTGVKTKAVVKNLIEVHDEDGTMYKPVFEFQDTSNISREFVSSVSSRPAAYQIGETVKVVYNPKDFKEVKVISYWGLYRWSIILCCIAIPLIIIGGGYLLYTKG